MFSVAGTAINFIQATSHQQNNLKPRIQAAEARYSSLLTRLSTALSKMDENKFTSVCSWVSLMKNFAKLTYF